MAQRSKAGPWRGPGKCAGTWGAREDGHLARGRFSSVATGGDAKAPGREEGGRRAVNQLHPEGTFWGGALSLILPEPRRSCYLSLRFRGEERTAQRRGSPPCASAQKPRLQPVTPKPDSSEEAGGPAKGLGIEGLPHHSCEMGETTTLFSGTGGGPNETRKGVVCSQEVLVDSGKDGNLFQSTCLLSKAPAGAEGAPFPCQQVPSPTPGPTAAGLSEQWLQVCVWQSGDSQLCS